MLQCLVVGALWAMLQWGQVALSAQECLAPCLIVLLVFLQISVGHSALQLNSYLNLA